MTAVAARALRDEPDMPEAAQEDRPTCVNHPTNASTAPCARCGDFVCDVCVVRAEGVRTCPRCFELRVERAELRSVQRKFRAPGQALGIAVLSVVSLMCVVPLPMIPMALGGVAIGFGIHALMKIRARPALRGRGSAIAAIMIGSATVIGSIVASVWWIRTFVE